MPRLQRDQGFRRRGYRSRQRVLLSRVGRLELRLAQVGCRCGRRFAPLLQLLGIESGMRVAPGLARRAASLATETSFAKAADYLAAEAGAAPSVRSIKQLVRDAGRRCDLTKPRGDLKSIPALLADGTRIPAGPRYGRKVFSARGVELNIACAVTGRDTSGRRPRAHIELVGATVARPWSALEPAVRACRDAAIAVTDGDDRIDSMLQRAVPNVPRQHCTFHVHHNVWHRLWQDGIPMAKRDAVIDRLLGPINERDQQASQPRGRRGVRSLCQGPRMGSHRGPPQTDGSSARHLARGASDQEAVAYARTVSSRAHHQRAGTDHA